MSISAVGPYGHILHEIVLYVPEQDYGKGKKGFVPPVEWKVTIP